MLLALNGYHEKEATPGLLFYIILSFLSVVGIGAGGASAAHWLAAKPAFSKFGAAALAVPVFVIIGAVIISIVFFAAILVVRLYANK